NPGGAVIVGVFVYVSTRPVHPPPMTPLHRQCLLLQGRWNGLTCILPPPPGTCGQLPLPDLRQSPQRRHSGLPVSSRVRTWTPLLLACEACLHSARRAPRGTRCRGCSR